MTIVLPSVNYFRFVIEVVWYYAPAYIKGESVDRIYRLEPTLNTMYSVIIQEWV